jgi:hypothetical protein
MNGAQKLGFRTLEVLRRRVISAWRGFCLIHAGLEAGIQGLVNLSALLVSDAPEAGHPSEGHSNDSIFRSARQSNAADYSLFHLLPSDDD